MATTATVKHLHIKRAGGLREVSLIYLPSSCCGKPSFTSHLSEHLTSCKNPFVTLSSSFYFPSKVSRQRRFPNGDGRLCFCVFLKSSLYLHNRVIEPFGDCSLKDWIASQCFQDTKTLTHSKVYRTITEATRKPAYSKTSANQR